MRLVAPTLLLLVAACATPRAAGGPTSEPSGPPAEVLREAELARVRCLLVAPLENGSDAPYAAERGTAALVTAIDPGRTRVLPVGDLRAIFKETPLELPEGVSGALALELAELLGADAALYGAIEGRSRDRSPEVLVTLRLTLAGHRDLLFATSALVSPGPGEPFEVAVKRTLLDRARGALERLGVPGRHACFPRERSEALRAAAVSLRLPAPTPAPAPPAGPAPTAAAPPAPSPASAARARAPGKLHSARQQEWARRLLEGARVVLEDVSFATRTSELQREGGLADLAVVLAATPSLRVRLEAFVDMTSDPPGDGRLSMAMAVAAGQRLLELGVEQDRVTWAGRGAESPILPNFTARGRAANRRIEVVTTR